MILRAQREIIKISTGPAFSFSFPFPLFTEGANIVNEEFLTAYFKLGYRAPEFNGACRAGGRNNIDTYTANFCSMNIGEVCNIAKVIIHCQVNVSAIISVAETHTRRGRRPYPVYLDIDIVKRQFVPRAPGRSGIPHLCHAVRRAATGQPEELLAREGKTLCSKSIIHVVLRSQRKVIKIGTRPGLALAFPFPFPAFTEGANIIHEKFLTA